MANKEIKQTIKLEGEKEYSAALREAQRNLRTLRSELKAETAELGTNATAQQKNEAKAKSLKAQIAEQEKVVKTLQKALSEAKKDYGDNEDVVQKWEQKLNAARTTLANMKNGLNETESAMRGTSDATAMGVVATKSFADALNNIASVGEGVSSAIENIFTGLVSSVRDVVGELWEMISETAAKANRWTDIAGYWGTSASEIEKWDHAVTSSANSFEDFLSLVSKINLGGKGKLITEMLGISEVNYKDQWSYAIAVVDRINELQTSGKLNDNFWEKVFGEKKATKVMDIVNDWATIKENLTDFDANAGGYGLNSEDLQTMNDLQVQIATVETKWDALKDKIAGGFGTITAGLMVNVEGGLDALNDFLNAETPEEREAALMKIRENVESFFRKLADAIREGIRILNEVGTELQQSDDPVTRAIGDLMVALTDALSWIVDNADAVKTAFQTIFGVWLISKLTMIATKLAGILAQIKVLQGYKDVKALLNGAGSSGGSSFTDGGGGTDTIATSGGAGAAGGGIGAKWAAIKSALSNTAANIGMSFQMAGGASVFGSLAALGAAGVAGVKMIEANLEDEKLNQVYGHDNADDNMFTTMSDESWRRAWEYWRLYSDENMTGTEEAFDARDRLFESLERDGFDLSEQAVSLIESAFENYETGNDIDGLVDQIEQKYPGFFDSVIYPVDVAGAVNDHIDAVLSGGEYGDQVYNAFSDFAGQVSGLPGIITNAVVNGISKIKIVMDEQQVCNIITPMIGVGWGKRVVAETR